MLFFYIKKIFMLFFVLCVYKGDHFSSIRFYSKKNNKTEIKKKTETKPKPVQTDRFRFGSIFLDKNQFKPVWLGFSGLARFFQFGFGSVFSVSGL
jgi:hypothetical protein